MRVVLQRVNRASVTVEGETVGQIGVGLLALVGVGEGDDEVDARAAATKIVGMRIFPDTEGRMNRSVADAGGAILLVSQFTLLGDVRKGRRPAFVAAAPPDRAVPILAALAEAISEQGIAVAHGRFGAHMVVELVNDGPVTIVFDVIHGRVAAR
jgi:D-tyrosyl-tRNA(Tyr) deacylase